MIYYLHTAVLDFTSDVEVSDIDDMSGSFGAQLLAILRQLNSACIVLLYDYFILPNFVKHQVLVNILIWLVPSETQCLLENISLGRTDAVLF
jgi:hypothetical protein